MSAVDFSEWVEPDLKLTLRGRTYLVRPPSVEASGMVMAAAVLGEINLGLVDGEMPAELQELLDSIGDQHPGLGEAYDQMAADGVDVPTLDRMAYYSVFYWARGREYADTLAKLLWLPRDPSTPAEGDVRPKD